MTGNTENRGERRNRWRIAAWSFAMLIVLLPLIAMQARFQSGGMARVMVATIALMAGMQSPISPASEISGLTAFFVALWLISAWLFRKAALEQAPAGGC